MLGFLISLCVLALVLFVVWWVIGLVLKPFGAPEYIHQIIGAILILILLAWVLNGLGFATFDSTRWRFYGP